MKTNSKVSKRIISLVLTVLLVISLVPMSVFSTFAEELSEAADSLPEVSATIDTGDSITLKDADSNGYYDIGNADELYAFAVLVNGGNSSFNAELTADIVVNEGVMSAESTDARVWTPIGHADNKYIGTFDGNEHTVSGLYLNDSERNYVGLFGSVGNNGVVKNTGVINSYLNGCNGVGGVVGFSDHSTVTNCYNTGDVFGISGVGGVIGDDYFSTITNCYNTGVVSGNEYVGGVVGNNRGKITSCYNTGVVSGTIGIGGVAGDDRGTITNCYYLDTAYAGGIYGVDEAGSAEAKTAEQFASGEVAYLLQGTQEEEIWGQTIGTDTAPVIGGDKVYTFNNCIGEVAGYSNTESETLNHNFENGICTVCGGFEPATDENNDGVYEIGNAGQLYWFADKVNNDNANFGSADAILTADIVVNEGVMNKNSTDVRVWTPIGNDSNSYTGTFDGNNKTVSGLYVNDENKQNVGLLGYVDAGCEIKNTGIINSYFNALMYVGGVAGYAQDTTISNCYNTSTVVGQNYAGGVAGYANESTVANCYNTGVVDGNDGIGMIGWILNVTVENCYYLNTSCYAGIGNSSNAEGSIEAKTAEAFASGEVAYLLQGTQTEDVWGQKIGTETSPVLGGDKVYYGYDSCADDAAVYTNNANATNEKLDHIFDDNNGFCTACGIFEPATDENEDGVYEIGNAGQLYWFADKVNNDNANFGSANAILTADIVVNEGVMSAESTDARAWTPIGNDSNSYTGTFDGNNYTVSGLYFNNSEADYIGLFGYVGVNGAVNNTGVINSYFNGYYFVGGVVGVNAGTITNCYNTGTVSGDGHIGGVVGYNEGTVTSCNNTGTVNGSYNDGGVGGVAGFNHGTITNCYNTGTVSGGSQIGGMIGTNYSIINNCYNTGTVSGTDRVGGLVGYNPRGTIANCYNTGAVSGTEYIGGVVGNGFDSTAVTNCFYLDTTCTAGFDGEDIAGSAEAKTAEQFASGEVAYLLQGEQSEEIWGQKIGTDVLPSLGGDKVYAVTKCNGEITGYNNTESVVLDHNFENGFCTVCGGFEPATDENNDGVYEIGNAGQLYWFADKVNNDNANFGSADAILTADIVVNEGTMSAESTDARVWTPIGNDDSNSYTGTFDGNNKTVSGLYFNNSEADEVGLFGYVGENGTVKNTGVINSYFNGGYYDVGGVVGANYGTITNCYNTGEVSGRSVIGGVVGENNGTITNCYNTGDVSCEYEYVGGVAGYNSSTITNCYYLDTACSGGINGADSAGSAEAKTAEQFASGEVAYLLQGEQEELVWGQKIGTETAPVLGGDKVYYGYTSCAYDSEMVYTNTEVSNEKPAHKELRAEFDWNTPYDGECYVYLELYCSECGGYVASDSDYATIKEKVEAEDCMHPGYDLYEVTFEYNGVTYTDTKSFTLKSDNHVGELENGFCTECGGYEPATLNDNGTPDDEWDDYYEISNAGQLYWFAEHAINDQYARAVLTDDIIVNEDLNAENLREWISIGESSSMPYCGSFDGQGHYISGLYAKSELNYIGLFGAIGWGASISNLGIKDSYFEGNYYVGGIVGYNDFSYIKNCYAENVEIVAVSSGAAVVGYNYGEVSNSYSTSDSFVGNNNYGTITNCYYLAGEEIHNEDGLTFKTAEQFASGEVAYLLQSGVVGEEIWDDELGEYVQTEPEHIWGQKIGEDTYPVFGGDKVYTVNNCIDEVAGYSNTEGEILDHIDYENGFCTLCGDFEPATLNEDGVYEIGNAGQLYWFAEYVNAGNVSADAILTADIVVNEGTVTESSTDARVWTPIGNWSNKYTGTFDGNDYTVSGLYFNDSEVQYVGLFGVIGENGAVKNTGVINSYFNGDECVGGVSGYNFGTVTNCYSTAKISADRFAGGIVGCSYGIVANSYNTGKVNGNNSVSGVVGVSQFGTIINCYNTGEVSGTNNVGGILGESYSATIANCYNTGTVNGNYCFGAIFGYGRNYDASNCYYLDSSCSFGTGDDSIYGPITSIAKTGGAFASGEVAYLLQGEQTEDIWGQKIGTDELPTIGGDKVYCGYYSCADDVAEYTNNSNVLVEKPDHNYVNGFCTLCGGFEPATLNEDGVFEIANAGQLYWFANMVNYDNANFGYADAILTADIVANEGVMSAESEGARAWTPIGNFDNYYTGTFDGQNHTVSGLYFNNSGAEGVGLFGNLEKSGTVKNTGVINSYFNGYLYVGGVVGLNEYGTITNCYNTGVVSGETYVGGVVSTNDYYGTITNCYNTGVVSGEKHVGGVVGANFATITNCYNTGTVRARNYVGGVVGWNEYGPITNCYNTGEVSGLYDLVGGVAGENHGTITNCYYLDSAFTGGIGGKDVAGSAEAKTAEQFKSGEVAYLLGDAFGQKIGTDQLPTLGGDKVYYGYITCDEDDNTIGYTNLVTSEETRPDHDFVNGFCTVCDIFEPATDVDNDGVYEIANAGQLYWFAELVNSGNTSANAILTADIVVNEGAMTAETDSTAVRHWTPMGNYDNQYTGTFNGNNHTVSGLYFNNTDIYDVGLFGYIGENGAVKNTGVINSYFNGKFYVGGVVGSNYGKITNCYNTGDVSATEQVGGVVGYHISGTIENCYNSGSVSGSNEVGGVVGDIYSATISNCYNTGSVSGTGRYIGGVVGSISDGTISDCYNTGTVSGADNVGGVVGYNPVGTIIDCYNTGDVSGTDGIGGLVGYNSRGTIGDCYNTGTVSGTDKVGGLVGFNPVGTIANCYNTGAVSGTEYIGGVVGSGFDSTAVTNCFYLDTTCTAGFDGEDIAGSAEAKTAEQFKSGEVAYLLGDAFGQKIGTDEIPVLGGDKVYTVINCKDEVVGYSNTEGEILDHNFEDGFCTICGDMDGIAQVGGYTISLGGNIAVNYYMVLSDEVLADENAEMVFTVPNGGSTYEVRIPVSSVTPDANGYYMFTCEVAAKEMASKIAAQIVISNNESDVFEYSVKQYAEYILAKAEEANNITGGGVAGGIVGGDGASNLLSPEMLSYVKAAPLVKAMLNYGANAQIYFNHNTDILANATLDEADKALVDNLDLSEYNVSVTGSEDGVVFYGGALSLKSETAIKLYFVIEEGTAIPEVTVNGKAYELTKNGTLYELKISDIPAHRLSEVFEVKVGGITIIYGAFSYGNVALGTSKEALKNVVRAMYEYNQQAVEYIK